MLALCQRVDHRARLFGGILECDGGATARGRESPRGLLPGCRWRGQKTQQLGEATLVVGVHRHLTAQRPGFFPQVTGAGHRTASAPARLAPAAAASWRARSLRSCASRLSRLTSTRCAATSAPAAASTAAATASARTTVSPERAATQQQVGCRREARARSGLVTGCPRLATASSSVCTKSWYASATRGARASARARSTSAWRGRRDARAKTAVCAGACAMEPAGIEPATSCLQSRRSPS